MLLAFNKPFNVLSQFTVEHPGQRTLAEFGFPKNVYPLGRLDSDSEGLLLLSDEAGLNEKLLDPKRGHWRTYLAQVEGTPTGEAIRKLEGGVVIQGRKTLPARAGMMEEPAGLWERHPPIRFRQSIPTAWLEISLREGKNRQVRRMTAAVGLPTLRLIRRRIGKFVLPVELSPGKWREMTTAERQEAFA